MRHLFFSNQIFSLIVISTCMLFSGCHKDEKSIASPNQKQSAEFRNQVVPTVENGTLKFNNKEDVIQYLHDISSILESDQPFENNFPSFNSLYELHKNYDGISENNAPYFIDDRLNAILNENYEVIIGDRVYVKKNLDETWSVLKNDSDGLNKLRQKLPGDYFKPEDDSESFLMENGSEIEVLGVLSCKAKIRIVDKTIPDPSFPILSTSNGINTYCVEVFGISGGNVESITVNWGDGTPPTTSTFNQCHTYTSRGDFRINVSVKLSCNNTPFLSTRLVSPLTSCCNLKNSDEKDVIIGDLKMKANFQRNIFLTSFFWLAKTRSFSITNGKVNAFLKSQITAIFRDHVNCNELSNEGDSDSCTSCNLKKVDLWHNENDNILNKHADVSITCTMIRNGVTLTHTFVPNCN